MEAKGVFSQLHADDNTGPGSLPARYYFGWIYHAIRFIALFLVPGIYGSNKTASIRMTWIMLIMFLPIFGTIMYLLVGLNAFTWKMRKRFDEIDRVLFPLLPENRDTEAGPASKSASSHPVFPTTRPILQVCKPEWLLFRPH